MKSGYLSQYFTGVAAKRLSAVEADPYTSNQHEFNGVESLKQIFGEEAGKQKFPTRFIYLTDQDSEPVVADAHVTWYDARERHPTRSERRLYFPTTNVSECAAEGDLLIIARRPDASVLIIVAENGSTIGNQVLWLLGLGKIDQPGFSVRSELETLQDRVEFPARFILEQIGVEVQTATDSYLDVMLKNFGGTFPTTRIFSEYARSTLHDVDAADNPDAALMAWMEREETLFRELERHIIADKVTSGFNGDVDGFLSYSLSVQNRRKSRVGAALENHLEKVFLQCDVRYSRTSVTENRAKPDFLFPGGIEYQDPTFPVAGLNMLGVKSTCKDRWRQVLSEAERIKEKHLFTLEAAISSNQTDEMKANSLALIIPRSLHSSYSLPQQKWILDLANFIEILNSKKPLYGNLL